MIEIRAEKAFQSASFRPSLTLFSQIFAAKRGMKTRMDIFVYRKSLGWIFVLRRMASGSLAGAGKGRQSIEAEQDRQEGLKRMDYQYEQDSIVLGNGVGHDHTLDSKMPGSSAVGCRYEHGKGAYHKGHQSSRKA